MTDFGPTVLDLPTDPEELKNAAPTNPDLVVAMAKSLLAWLVRTHDPAVTDERYRKIFTSLP